MSDKQSHAHTSLTRGSNSSLALSGTISTLVGATTGGSESTCAWSDTLTMVKCAYPAFNVLFPTPKRVFQKSVEDTPKSKRGLDDVGGKFPN